MLKLERYKVALHSERLFKAPASCCMHHALCVCMRLREWPIIENASEGMGERRCLFCLKMGISQWLDSLLPKGGGFGSRPEAKFSSNFFSFLLRILSTCNFTQKRRNLPYGLPYGTLDCRRFLLPCPLSESPSFPMSVWGARGRESASSSKHFLFIFSSLHSGTLQKYTTGHCFPSEEFLGWKKHAYVGEGLHTHVHHLNASYAFSVLTQHRLVVLWGGDISLSLWQLTPCKEMLPFPFKGRHSPLSVCSRRNRP